MDNIKKIVSEVFNIEPEKINNDSSPDNIEMWDSLGQLALVLAIEQKYKITLEIQEIFLIMNVGDIYKILKQRGIIN